MKILLDACVPRPLCRRLAPHIVRTAQEEGWAELKNGALLAVAEQSFDLFLTSDKNIKYQQNLSGRKIAILVLPTNDWPTLRAKAAEIQSAIDSITPPEFVELIWR